jgi:pimeloyl-ACP methyl ester carboxylesterase
MQPQIHQITASGGKIRNIAYLRHEGAPGKPGVFWLHGFNSRMTSQKAESVARWCGERGLSCLRFDYSGHGESSGTPADGVIGDWLEEAAELFARYTSGPQIIGASSMGGWLALLLARRLAGAEPGRIKAIVTIAPAWDMTETLMWQRFPEEVQAAIMRDGVFTVPSEYEAGGYPITRALIEDGRRHLLGGTSVETGCAVRILHGMQDADVPWQQSLRLAEMLSGGDVRLTLVKDGDHRLSRDADMALLLSSLGEFAG